MAMYVYPSGTEKTIKNMYIGEYWWHPWANTIAYYPLTSDINDYSWNNRNLTQGTWTVTYNSNTNMAEIDGKLTYSQALLPRSSDFTFWFWCYPNSWNNIGDENSWWPLWYMVNMPWEPKWNFKIWGSWKRLWWTSTVSWPCHLMVTRSGSTFTLYVNWQPDSTITNSGTIDSSNDFYIVSRPDWIGAVIIESVARTATEVTDYYDQTKWNYGL